MSILTRRNLVISAVCATFIFLIIVGGIGWIAAFGYQEDIDRLDKDLDQKDAQITQLKNQLNQTRKNISNLESDIDRKQFIIQNLRSQKRKPMLWIGEEFTGSIDGNDIGLAYTAYNFGETEAINVTGNLTIYNEENNVLHTREFEIGNIASNTNKEEANNFNVPQKVDSDHTFTITIQDCKNCIKLHDKYS